MSPDYRLADCFDYVAGTSTGGIIAAGIALGMSVAEILNFYVRNGANMFSNVGLLRRLNYKFDSQPLAQELKAAFGETIVLGSPEIECLLLLMMRNATTDSPWLPLGQSAIIPSQNITTSITPLAISRFPYGNSYAPAQRHLLNFRQTS
jgi:hypothetical protein